MKQLLLVTYVLIALMGCKKDDVVPAATTSTGSSTGGSSKATAITADGWTFWVSNWVTNGVSNGSKDNPNQYQSSLTSEATATTSPITGTGIGGLPTAKIESYSLAVAAPINKDTASFSYWVTALTPPKTLQIGKSLTLRAKVQLQDVQGKGVSLALRGDRTAQSAVLFASTQASKNIAGTSDFTEYSVTLPYTTSVDYILVYLVMLNKTTGKAIFKDISIQVN